ncbi:cryptochrome/photolyase family protein [Nocardioides houyundeii]|uniref:cryptochrome/photolyase family protein n=1 Tax=Nocardioides houyundeii TaxID=2045452 RepID=UPI001F53746E|nr:deoxyribodipyrimidine photo-lyase [Nocardioides houyundeii]
MPTVMWFRRDLRLSDHPALLAALEQSGSTVALFVLDPRLMRRAGPVRRAWLAANLLALDERTGGRLVVRRGDPAKVVPEVVAEVEADQVHVSAETTPYGAARDAAVASALAELGHRTGRPAALRATGSPYAVGPGLVRKGDDEPYRVFTPFARAWREHGWAAPAASPETPGFVALASASGARDALVQAADGAADLPEAGEEAAWRRWHTFRDGALGDYRSGRDRPDLDGTSRLSPYLSLGVLHPRSLLADLPGGGADDGTTGPAAEAFVSELAWREFYADVLHHRPDSAWADLRPGLGGLRYSEEADAVAAWRTGTTGYPVVDAGMRQLLGQGWMHNRLRMITASFLTKDLHVWWPVGARHFLRHLADADLASNNHGWQWVAGTGTDASPYFRVFNPVSQGMKFDPAGDYVRRWVPELRHLPGRAAHEPWEHEEGYAHGYPARIVDHADERREALARYAAVRGASGRGSRPGR